VTVEVLGVGDGGVPELVKLLDDSMVAWALLKFSVGAGTFERTKFLAIHFNGEEVSPVMRGRLNARSGDMLKMLGQTHATLEVGCCHSS